MNPGFSLTTLGRLLERGSERKRLRQLGLSHCLARHGRAGDSRRPQPTQASPCEPR
ncbi:hypothetical protein [Motiliproteus sp. SC1-56]|uniref:hypothetical protein n=1 Tax=Motiliproteus sp. SC1-56 TaxID=2799565 RepID=UPI001A8C6AA8|nr:hypothetical protein [Motiliproteus sp. SC1-56]